MNDRQQWYDRLRAKRYAAPARRARGAKKPPEPRVLKLETTSRCNARCIFCGHGPGGRDMPWELFTAVIDAFPAAEEVQPQWWGEPLLWPRIVDGVRYARRKGKRVVFYTNGSLLAGELAEALADAEPTRVIFSVDTHLPEVYERIRPPLRFGQVLANIEAFQRIKRPGTRTSVRATETAETAPTIAETARYWASRVDTVQVRAEFPRTRGVATARYAACSMPSYELVVRTDGSCCLCCNDWKSEAVLGHVSEGLPEVWGRYARWTAEKHPLCDGCLLRWAPTAEVTDRPQPVSGVE